MNPEEVDQMIRDTQHRHVDGVNSSGDPIPDIFSRVRRARRKRRTVTAVTVAALAVAGAIGAVAVGSQLTNDDDTNIATAPPTSSPGSPNSSPPVSGPPRTRDDVLRTQLAANPSVRNELLGSVNPTGTVLCATHLFGSDAGGRRLYIWVTCGAYATGPGARMLSGGGDPAVVSVSGSGIDTEIVAIQFPRIAHLDQDIAAMFPPEIVTQVQRRDFETVPTNSQLLAEARQLGAS